MPAREQHDHHRQAQERRDRRRDDAREKDQADVEEDVLRVTGDYDLRERTEADGSTPPAAGTPEGVR